MPGIVSSISIPATLQTGAVSIPNGATTIAVVFEVPFRFKPVVNALIEKEDESDPNVFLTVITGITKDGFTAFLSDSTTNGNYRINYQATGI